MATTPKTPTSKPAETTKPGRSAGAASAASDAGRDAFDVRKTVSDAGYIAVGLGVLGYQQAQVRRARLVERIQSRTSNLGSCARTRREDLSTLPAKVAERLGADDLRDRVRELGSKLDSRLASARERANEIGEQTRTKVAPAIDTFETRVSELPNPLPQAAAPAVRVARQLVSATA
jgi:ElaB/YqjD/DUF883 family membrane-anchored ribosome-binding protein